ncbi:ABC transporter ATP-binding protein [Caldalkalibacillus salinus]|uniref:ABC transporter ATP-binding protein n=1 Tax=Caldalkalibacillus salinus TaxID=2803787 RepID=UPI0019246237|nr:ABC transporter ATP-binding protein [Caldalkalibacillus salinus]
MSTQSLIKLQGVSHVYVSENEANLAVRHIDLTVEKGEFISLVGPSGCGKTTVLSSIAGLITPTEGEVIIKGQTLTHPTPSVGYMLQADYLFEWQNILENVLIGVKVMDLDQKTRQQKEKYAHFLLQEMGLSEYKEHLPSQLSGGMRQRAALVRTLVTNPDILLLDEPFSALDYQTKLKLEDLVFDTLKKHEKTAVLVTHDIAESIAMSDRIVVLDQRPGEIKGIVDVPAHIRNCLPFEAREQEGFNALFHKIWKELDQDES